MTLALRYAVRSDVGLLREGNEDSAYAGPHLLAVADGMGGHAAGEVASAATITTIAPLDSEHAGADLVGVLADAVATANLRLQELIMSDPAIEGMGTTLTALLWSNGYAALCHIGDSRAYLLRDGQLIQITHDHTLVQSLVDEGKITEDDVATHPHRSLLLRALDGRTVAEPDLNIIETVPGDRFLLCSDGLSGVVTEQTLHHALGSIADPDKVTLQLVELAIKGGGPDNITCIVADVMDTQASPVPPTWAPVLAGAAAQGGPGLRAPARQSSPATRAMRLTKTTPQPSLGDEPPTGVWQHGNPDDYGDGLDSAPFGAGRREGFDDEYDDGFGGLDDDADLGEPGDRGARRRGRRSGRRYAEDNEDGYGRRSGKRRWPIVTAALALLVLLLGGGGYGAWWYNQRQYYVGAQDGYVAIFRGTNQNLAGINLSSLVSRSTLRLSQLGPNARATIVQTISKGSLTDAKTLIDGLQGEVNQCRRKWTALVDWQAANVKYQAELAAIQKAAAKSKSKTKAKTAVPAKDKPGPMPPQPNAADCAAATAFGITPSELPGGQPTSTQLATPSSTKSASPSAKATTKATKATARSTATPKASSTPRATP